MIATRVDNLRLAAIGSNLPHSSFLGHNVRESHCKQIASLQADDGELGISRNRRPHKASALVLLGRNERISQAGPPVQNETVILFKGTCKHSVRGIIWFDPVPIRSPEDLTCHPQVRVLIKSGGQHVTPGSLAGTNDESMRREVITQGRTS
jgi:hypothetical protein